MTQEEKQLILIDLCARLPYNVKYKIKTRSSRELDDTLEANILAFFCNCWSSDDNDEITYVKPYLRPMSSMTDEERNEWMEITHAQEWLIIGNLDKATDWLNKNMFDYRGLIPMGLALEAPESMYKNE